MTLTIPREPVRVQTIQFTGITADQLLTFTNPKGEIESLLQIADVDWERIILDIDVTTLTGTNVIFKLKSCLKKGGTAIAATTMDAKDSAGNNVVSATLTAAGRSLVVVSRAGSNIGGLIGVYADVSSLSALVGTISIYVGK